MNARRVRTTDQRPTRGHCSGNPRHYLPESERVAAAELQADHRGLTGDERAEFIANWKPKAHSAGTPWKVFRRF